MKPCVVKTGLVLSAILATVSAHSASVGLDTVTARPNAVAQVPVNISAATDLTGVNLRLEYDPGVFSSPSLLREGSLLEVSHVLTSYSPEAGKFNVVAYAPPGTSPFAGRSGTVFSITLQVASSAPQGSYPITFTRTGPALLASSGLSDVGGESITHTALPGSVVIRSATSCDLTGDDRVTCEDLLLLIKDWHRTSAAPLLPGDINQDTVVDEQDIMIFSKDWQKTY